MVNPNLKFDIAVYFYQNYGISMESIAFESHMVGFNVFINEKCIRLYIRFWEQSKRHNGLPDKCVILVTANFKTHEKRNVRNLTKFLNQVAPRYGYEFLAVENNDELNGHLNLMEVPVKHSTHYFAPLGEELAEQLED
ncbi:MAG: hypothetical protein IJ647_08070 [Prevotella sp.]|nr:hypothetical protein [Prevotella sp.]